jgi:hypothetical protein
MGCQRRSFALKTAVFAAYFVLTSALFYECACHWPVLAPPDKPLPGNNNNATYREHLIYI